MGLAFLLLTCLLWLMTEGQAAPLTVWDTRAGKTLSQRDLLDRLVQADVVFVGEQHDSKPTHALELGLLQDLHRRVGKRLTLGMEMWERDAQPALGAYLVGKTNEAAFLATARPWPNYRTDYRPLVEYARAEAIPVIASNVPQALASRVGRNGLDALKDAPAGQVATLVQAPHDAYWERFQSVMQAMAGGHGGMTMDAATIERFYEAQVLRDETMAESIAARLESMPRPLVLHVNGDFHSDYGQGIPKRVLWRRPLTHILIISVVPAAAPPASLSPADKMRADFVIYVPAQVQ